MSPLTRRQSLAALLQAIAVVPLSASFTHAAETPSRIVALDWAGADCLLSLGVTPIGVGDTEGYRTSVVEPALPGEVPDVGEATAPNMEILQRLRPDLIVISPWLANKPLLNRVAPTYEMQIYLQQRDPFTSAEAEVRRMAELLGVAARAERFLSEAGLTLDAMTLPSASRQRPAYIAMLLPDGRHASISTGNSLASAVMGRLGLRDAWTGTPSPWGFQFSGIERLGENPEATILYVDQGLRTTKAERLLARSRVWQALPAVKAGRVARIAPFYLFGGVNAGLRFAATLKHHFESQEP